MPPKKRSQKTKVNSTAVSQDPVKAITTLEKEISALKVKQEKTQTQWLTKLKKQVSKGGEQLKKLRDRIKKAKTASTKNTIRVNLKALEQKQQELKTALSQGSAQDKKLKAEERCVAQFEKDYSKESTSKKQVKKKAVKTTKTKVKTVDAPIKKVQAVKTSNHDTMTTQED